MLYAHPLQDLWDGCVNFDVELLPLFIDEWLQRLPVVERDKTSLFLLHHVTLSTKIMERNCGRGYGRSRGRGGEGRGGGGGGKG